MRNIILQVYRFLGRSIVFLESVNLFQAFNFSFLRNQFLIDLFVYSHVRQQGLDFVTLALLSQNVGDRA